MMRSWLDLGFWQTTDWERIKNELHTLEESKQDFYPSRSRVLQAFKLTPFRRVRAVILGQDPYHDGAATGLAFSANRPNGTCPPSLRNIFQEYRTDLGHQPPSTGNLATWAKRGVLLLNTSLTVLPGKPTSHANLGWSRLIEEVLYEVAKTWPTAVFVLWGAHAQSAAIPHIGGSPRVTSSHPAPYSANAGTSPFFGSRPFTKVNALLRHGKAEAIDWRLP